MSAQEKDRQMEWPMDLPKEQPPRATENQSTPWSSKGPASTSLVVIGSRPNVKACITPRVLPMPPPLGYPTALLPAPKAAPKKVCETPRIIPMPPPANPIVALLSAPRISPRADLITTAEGRILRRVHLEEEEARSVLEIEEGIGTKDLGEAAELLRSHDDAYYREYLNSCMDAFRMKDQYLYGQDGYENMTSFIKASATELGVSIGDFYRRVATGEVIDRFMRIELMGQWGITEEEIVRKAPRLSYILTAYYRHIPFEAMKEPFLNWPFEGYVAFMVGRKPKTLEERDASKAAKYEEQKAPPPILTPTEAEREIVSIIRKGLDAKPVGLNDLSHVQYLQKAQRAFRRELTDIAYEKKDPLFYKTERVCTEVSAIHTLADAKFMFMKHMAKGVPNRLICYCLSAQINDVPELVAQREALGYKNTHDYLVRELGVVFDTYRAIKIGQNYLKHEETVLRLLGNITSEIKLGMLFSLDCAIDNHGDHPELIERFLRPETPLADWEAFAAHCDYEKYLAKNRMSPAKIKEARRIIFDYHEAKKKALPFWRKPEVIGGDKIAIFSVVLEEEKSFLDRCLWDLEYLRKYVEKYAWYKDNGLIP